jgi:hypothetical protein
MEARVRKSVRGRRSARSDNSKRGLPGTGYRRARPSVGSPAQNPCRTRPSAESDAHSADAGSALPGDHRTTRPNNALPRVRSAPERHVGVPATRRSVIAAHGLVRVMLGHACLLYVRVGVAA